MKILTCPICLLKTFGGMTLVRHLYDEHAMDVLQANQIVDKLYEECKMPQVMVNYEYLNAKECEELKERVAGKEKEFFWGTCGPKNDEEVQKYSIKELSTQHLENLLITQRHLDNELAAAILMLLKKRYGV